MNKSKKTSILLVIALIICMGLTAGLTMAFFGGTSTGSSTVTLKTGVKVGATATASNDGAMVVPGQPIDISATGTVEPYSSTGTVVPALLRLKFTIGGAMDVTPTLNTTDAMTIKTEAGDATGYWVLHTDGYYYLCAEAAEATVANTQLLKFTPVNTTTEEDKTKVSLTGNFVVPTSLGNEASNQSLDINARFEVIQAEIYANGSDTAIADENLTIGNEAVQEVFGEFAPVEGIVSYVNETSTLASAQFKNGQTTLVIENPEYYEDDDSYGYIIPIQFDELQNNSALNISFSVAHENGALGAAIYKGLLYNVDEISEIGDLSQVILHPEIALSLNTGEYIYDGITHSVNTYTIVGPTTNGFTILLGAFNNVELLEIDFKLSTVWEVSEQNGAITPEFNASGEATVSAISDVKFVDFDNGSVQYTLGCYYFPIRLTDIKAGTVLNISPVALMVNLRLISDAGYDPDCGILEGIYFDNNIGDENIGVYFGDIMFAEDTDVYEFTYLYTAYKVEGEYLGPESIFTNIVLTLTQDTPNVIDFADIKNATDQTLTLNISEYNLYTTGDWFFTQERGYHFTIENITESCNIEVTYALSDDQSSRNLYACKFTEGFVNKYIALNSSSAKEPSNTFTLPASGSFNFNFVEGTYDGPPLLDEIQITIKIVTG